MSYSISSIVINNREVKLIDILSGSVTASSSFETSTFSFIKDWFQEVDSFSQQTSGSTGTPKEIHLTRKQLQQSAQRTIKALGLNQNDTAFVCLDTKYIAGKMMLVRAFEGNMRIIAVEPTSNSLQKLASDVSISFAAFVPLQLHAMINHPESAKRLSLLNTLIIGGGEVDKILQDEIQKLSCAAYATYGMTETVSHIALQRLNGKDRSTHFTTLPDIRIEVDNRGCLVIDVPGFSERIYTNDLVELLSPTNFQWLGRFDNVVNSGGFKISPEKIEKVIEGIFQERKIERSFFACGIPDKQLGQKLILVIEGFPIAGGNKILAALKKHLHPFEVPKQIFHIREFIRTETGKINRISTAGLID